MGDRSFRDAREAHQPAAPAHDRNPAAKNRLYNICMDEPVDYGAVAAYLKETRGLDSLDIPSSYHSNWMDNSLAKFELAWRPRYDLKRLIDAAWSYQRDAADPRRVWYPG
jgi:UDP-glucose 4-epimerase